jgi:lipoprotein NlpD
VLIKGSTGQAIYAAHDGKVVYSGNGLKGYGNLIIIKHDNGYLTAYALNQNNLVKMGQQVKVGEKIAEMGKGGLHFELRKDGKPINPDYISGK